MDRSDIVNKKKHRGLKIFGVIILIILMLVIASAVAGALWYKNSLTAINPEKCTNEKCEIIHFVVKDGDSTASIARQLEEKGLIKSSLAFRAYMMLEAKDTTIKSGAYDFTKDMSVQEIIKSFNEGAKAKTFQIMFLPGGTLANISKRLQDAGYKEEEINNAFKKQYDHPLLKSKPASASLEGYVYADTYEFYTTATVEEILTRTFDEMYQVIKENDLEAKYRAKGFNLHQGITLASIVQSEAGIMDEQDQRTVAQVFLTRLKNGSVLGSDAIIAYRADQLNPNRDKTDMSYLDTVTCPWNSRKCAGLPTTPISSPGKTALLAIANPSNTDYYYFISGYDSEGKLKMFYAHTEAEHNENIKNYCGNLCEKL